MAFVSTQLHYAMKMLFFGHVTSSVNVPGCSTSAISDFLHESVSKRLLGYNWSRYSHFAIPAFGLDSCFRLVKAQCCCGTCLEQLTNWRSIHDVDKTNVLVGQLIFVHPTRNLNERDCHWCCQYSAGHLKTGSLFFSSIVAHRGPSSFITSWIRCGERRQSLQLWFVYGSVCARD